DLLLGHEARGAGAGGLAAGEHALRLREARAGGGLLGGRAPDGGLRLLDVGLGVLHGAPGLLEEEGAAHAVGHGGDGGRRGRGAALGEGGRLGAAGGGGGAGADRVCRGRPGRGEGGEGPARGRRDGAALGRAGGLRGGGGGGAPAAGGERQRGRRRERADR